MAGPDPDHFAGSPQPFFPRSRIQTLLGGLTLIVNLAEPAVVSVDIDTREVPVPLFVK